MKLLLDTHVVLWRLYQPEQLTMGVAALLQRGGVRLVSAASIWEVAIKRAKGALAFVPDTFPADVAGAGFQRLDVTWVHAWRAGALPRHHDDPFDRMLVAQALEEDALLVTRDHLLAAYGLQVIAA